MCIFMSVDEDEAVAVTLKLQIRNLSIFQSALDLRPRE